jgi:hypothetical protein
VSCAAAKALFFGAGLRLARRHAAAMAAAEEEARQKALKALREKQDMLIAIKERKAEGQLIKYYANDKFKVATWERDPEGYLPIHWAGEAQCKQNVFEVLLCAYPEGVKELTNKTKEKPGGDGVLHLLCKGIIVADTEKAFNTKVLDKAVKLPLTAHGSYLQLRMRPGLWRAGSAGSSASRRQEQRVDSACAACPQRAST